MAIGVNLRDEGGDRAAHLEIEVDRLRALLATANAECERWKASALARTITSHGSPATARPTPRSPRSAPKPKKP